MYAGHIVELGPVLDIFNSPQHPYTQALLGAVPRLHNWPDRLTTIEGAPPSLTTEIVGCPFYPRCPVHVPRCQTDNPALIPLAPNHSAACWVAEAAAAVSRR